MRVRRTGTSGIDGWQYDAGTLIRHIQVQSRNNQSQRLRLWFKTVPNIIGVIVFQPANIRHASAVVRVD